MARFVDLTGQKFGKLTVIERTGVDKHHHTTWLCECDCGNRITTTTLDLRREHTTSCGCIRAKDMINQKYGKLTVLERAGSKNGSAFWKCRCDCGNKIIVRGDQLRSGNTRSCGCLHNAVDYSGQKFGRLTVIKRAENNKHGNVQFLCRCDCGKELVLPSSALTTGNTRSCGCLYNDQNRLPEGEASFNKIYRMYQKSAANRKVSFTLDKERFRQLISSPCYYCGREPYQQYNDATAYGNIIYTGIDRINNNEGYTTDNVRSCCKQCNYIKNIYSESEFYTWINNVYTNYIKEG
jgi:hypothetical protein